MPLGGLEPPQAGLKDRNPSYRAPAANTFMPLDFVVGGVGIEPTGIPKEKWFTATFGALPVPAGEGSRGGLPSSTCYAKWSAASWLGVQRDDLELEFRMLFGHALRIPGARIPAPAGKAGGDQAC